MRKPVIGVMGGGTATEAVAEDAYRVGALIAARGWILLNGGRNVGVMAASTRGAKDAGGMVVGILPDRDDRQAAADLDVAIVTGMGDARNVINVLSSDVVIACSGGAGTLSEVALALKNGKPVILLNMKVGAVLDEYRRNGRLRDAVSPEDAMAAAESLLR